MKISKPKRWQKTLSSTAFRTKLSIASSSGHVVWEPRAYLASTKQVEQGCEHQNLQKMENDGTRVSHQLGDV